MKKNSIYLSFEKLFLHQLFSSDLHSLIFNTCIIEIAVFKRNIWIICSYKFMMSFCQKRSLWVLIRLYDSRLQSDLINNIQKLFKYTEIKYSRNWLYSLYQMITSDAVDQHCHDMQHHQDEYIVPGSNFLWSVDDYLKLKSYDIEIYTDIDAHFCYIIWIYVKITACTEVSVLKQFLNTLEMLKVQSQVIWSDWDAETVFLTETHHRFWQSYNSDVLLEKIYFYSSSVFN